MVIGIDIRVLNSPVRSGIEEYTENLLAHMLPLDKTIKYKLFTSSFRDIKYTQNWLSLPNTEVHKFKYSNKLLFLSANFNIPYVDKLIGGADIFFSPHFFLTPLSSGCKRATTFHDLSYLHFPEFFSWRKRVWHNLEMRPKWQARFSDKIIAVSESTKNDLTNLYNIDPAKIEVIYSGISLSMREFSSEERNLFRKVNKLPKDFILFMGKLEPRKNVVSLIKAFDIIKRNEGLGFQAKDISSRFKNTNTDFKDTHLIIVGSRGWLDNDIFKAAELSPNKHKIIFKDHIDDNLRAGYYNCASVFVYPSFFEGFGFPPLEAMACGTPTIVSANSSLPEVARGASILINPADTRELAIAMTSILIAQSRQPLISQSQSLRNSIVYEGLNNSKLFNWNKTAEETLSYLLK